MEQGKSFFEECEYAPPIEIFALTARYKQDPATHKVNLGVGAYRTEKGEPWVLPVVKSVEAQMAADATLNHEYLPVIGMPDFISGAMKLVLGENSPALTENRVAGAQAIGGTGAIRLCADFTKKILGYDTVYISKPTWANHRGVFKSAGFSDVREYRYWHESTKSLDFDGMMEDLQNAPQKSVIVLHAVAHNPTGVDPTEEQWAQIADLCHSRGLFVLMDNAYQGFTSGDVDKDAFSVRHFVKKGMELFIAQSFSKSFGLYNERVGNLCMVCKDKEIKAKVASQMELVVRTLWSNSSNHGARIVATVLNNPALFSEWKEQLKQMSDRIKLMRKELRDKLVALGTPGKWDHIVTQQGMFSYTGLNPAQVDILIKKYHIYLLKTGRINMCGLTQGNMDYVANAIHDAVTSCHPSQQQTQSNM